MFGNASSTLALVPGCTFSNVMPSDLFCVAKQLSKISHLHRSAGEHDASGVCLVHRTSLMFDPPKTFSVSSDRVNTVAL